MYSPQPPTDGGWWEARLVLADGGGTVEYNEIKATLNETNAERTASIERRRTAGAAQRANLPNSTKRFEAKAAEEEAESCRIDIISLSLSLSLSPSTEEPVEKWDVVERRRPP